MRGTMMGVVDYLDGRHAQVRKLNTRSTNSDALNVKQPHRRHRKI